MAISDKLNYLIETKSKFKDRLNSLGAEITANTTFRNYLNWLDNFYIGSANKTDIAINGIDGRTSQNHTIPVEYTRVDYIESSGTQYIDTGVKANQDTITDVTLEINQFTEDYNVYFGSRYQFSSQAYELMSVYRPNYGIDPSIANTYNNGYAYTDIISTNTKYNIRKEKNVAYLDGNIIAEQEYAEFETPVNMYIFATNSNGNADYKSSIKLYKMTISDGTNIIRNFIPCYRNSDNVVGLYDIANDVFYTNQGTGTFTYGTVMVEPSPDYPLEINNLSGNVSYTVSGTNIETRTFTIPLGSIKLCGIDTYKDKIYSNNGRFYLEKNTDKIILNGNEYIDKYSVTGGNLFRFQDIAISVSNISPVSNYFIGVSNSSDRYDGTIYYNYNAALNHMVFDILTTKFTTVSEFKSWLSTHNTELQFAIPTSITTEITSSNYPELYAALKEIQDYLVSYKINKEFLLDYSSPEIEY